MRRQAVLIAACALALAALRAQQSTSPTRPRLVVLIVVDQMRADYFQRYAGRFADGFTRLWDRGAVFTDARYTYASTKTAEAHALMLSGWSPSASGIIGDRWYQDRVRINELAPTIGRLLGLEFKGDPKGRVLTEGLLP